MEATRGSSGDGGRLAGRFELLRPLGAGAFGAVFEALDKERDRRVAVKKLTRVTGATVYRFKREFRSLAEVEHPNLVRLGELFSAGDEWAFSMELIDGVTFDRWVRDVAHPEGGPHPNLDRLRAALAQLVAGVQALHGASVIHRDLKPANVLVTPEGRVVVLDFGLATEADPDKQKSVLGLPMGTPAYMAPEQAAGHVATAATDWYALGAMIFEALHGRVPFDNAARTTAPERRTTSEVRWPPPREGAEDLDDLCRALLAEEPDERPTGEEIARAVGARAFAPMEGVARSAGFVGRERELAELRAAYDAVVDAGTVILRLRGPSGVGKSALVRQFVSTLEQRAVVLQGRCYERESVPYKTLDGVVDSLTRYVSGLSVMDAGVLVPREAPALCRLFPVFGRLRILADQPERRRSSSPQDERRRGFSALREVLARIGDRYPLVVHIDDLQWGDEDSVAPLTELLAGPDAPRLLLVLSYRDVEEVLPVVQAIHAPEFVEAIGEVRDLDLGPLEPSDAVDLAAQLLPADQRELAPVLARESGGLPLFLPELVRAQERANEGDPVVSLDEALRARVAGVSEHARALLELVAVIGRPISPEIARRATGLDEGARSAALAELEREHFIYASSTGDGAIETFHERVRESVVGGLPDERRREHHCAFARALEESGADDPEAIAEHYRLAGDHQRARPATIAAAERATEAFAFERAIQLYLDAREGSSSAERRVLTACLADVLAYAGRGRDAAAAYLAATDGAPPDEARELRRRAAEHRLRCGAVHEGLALCRELVQEMGLPFPEGRGVLLASVIVQRVRLGLRGYKFEERQPGPEDERAVQRVDLCWTIGLGMTAVDLLRGAEYQTRHLRYALDLGEPSRVARGLALESILVSMEGKRDKGEQLARRGVEIARRIDHAHSLGFTAAALAVVHWCRARWRRAVEQADEALELYRTRSPQSVWEVTVLEVWYIYRALFFLGELERFVQTVRRTTRAAEDRDDDLMATASRSAGLIYVHLYEDDPDAARATSSASLPDWLPDEWLPQHQSHVRAQIYCDLYEGDGAAALARAREAMPKMKRSLILRTEAERVENYYEFAQAALLAGDAAQAEEWIAPLAKETQNPLAAAFHAVALAGVRAAHGDARAADAYEEAAARFDALEMVVYAAVSRWRRGQLLGGAEGEALCKRGRAALRERGVRDPEAFARVHVV